MKLVVQFGGTFVKKKLFISLLSATVLSTSLMGAAPVFADEFDTQLDEAQQTAAQNEQAANELNEIISQLTNEKNNTQAALTSLENEIQKKESLLTEAMNNLELSKTEMNQLQEEIEKLEENIARREDKLEEQARKIQVSGNSVSYLEYILESESLTDIFARIDVVTNIIQSSNSMMEDQIKDKEQVDQKTKETEQKIVQQNAIAGELEQASAQLESQKASQEALVVQLEIERSTASADKESLITERNEALERVNNIQNEREIARAAAQEAEEERARQEEVTEEVVEETTTTEVATASVAPASSNRESSNGGSTPNSQPASEETSTSTNNGGGNTQGSTTPTQSAPTQSTPKPESKPKPKPKPQPKPETTPPAASGNVLSIAGNYVGIPYVWGGKTPNGFDCSGFTKYVFAQSNKSIPAGSSAQYAGATKVSNPQPGDLVFFGRGSVSHVGIYVGNGRFIGAQTSTGVAYTTVSSFSKYGSPLIGYGRY